MGDIQNENRKLLAVPLGAENYSRIFKSVRSRLANLT